ncbi:hypothetical protein V5F32_08305 [Xanthobacter oligotrophicus]|uniref:Uncharacterized protein n=1 Tax=Xanthobacter oligotrophicus TaxID=2607286 RepID=A0ABW6ZTU7_9HYPH
MTVLGIDPGISGAWALLHTGGTLAAGDLPVAGGLIDAATFSALMRGRILPPEGSRQLLLTVHWQTYCAAVARAQASRDIRDSIDAGEPWRKWLALFLPTEHQAVLSRFGRRL